MIIKCTQPGDSAGGLMLYLVGPGKQEEHIDPQVITGTIGHPGPLSKDEAWDIAEDLETFKRINDVKIKGGHVFHAAMSVHYNEGRLPNEKWSNMSEEFMEHMGYGDDSRWVAIHHGPNTKGNDHIHVVATRVLSNGRKVSDWHSWRKASLYAKTLEDKYGLKPLPGRHAGTASQGYSKNDAGRAKALGTEPRRIQIERMVRAAAAGSASEDQFVANLSEQGLRFKPYITEGKVRGYSVNLPDTTTAKGQEHWWAGGKLAKDLAYPRLKQWWDQDRTAVPSHVTAVNELRELQTGAPFLTASQLADGAHQLSNALAAASTATEPKPGELAQMSRRMSVVAQTKTYTWEPKPPALSAGALFLQCKDPTGPVGQTVMIRQMLAASRAVLEAHLARACAQANKEGTPSMAEAPEDEVLNMAVTVGSTTIAMATEGHARRKQFRTEREPHPAERKGWEAEPWDAKTISRFAAQDRVQRQFRPPPGAMSDEQRAEIELRSAEIGIPVPASKLSTLNADQADALLRDLATIQGTPPLQAQAVPAGMPPPQKVANYKR